MKVHRIVYTGVLLTAAFVAQVNAGEFNLTVSAGVAIPVGDFGKKTDIIEPTPDFGGYSAGGGAAETGFGFDVELEAGVTQRVFVGGRFGYSRHGADASDLIENVIVPLAPDVEDVDAVWTFSSLGGFVRVIALDSPTINLYGRLGVGAVKMKNTFDVTFDLGDLGEATFTSDFSPGNQFFIAGAFGAEYRIWDWASLVGEFKLTHMLTDGAEATAYFSQYEITGTQNFYTQSLDIRAGLRIPLSGI